MRLVGQRRMDDRVVYDISLKPRSRLQTAFVGKVAVLDEEFGLLEVELVPVETITASIPMPIFEQFDIEYKQQFRPFAQGVWLPVDFRYEIRIKIGMIGLHFPLIRIRALTQLTDYQVNTVLPDSVSIEPEEEQSAPLVSTESSAGRTVEEDAPLERARIDTALHGMAVEEQAQTEDKQDDPPSAGVTVELHGQTEKVQVDTQAVRNDSLFILLKGRIPLSVREQEAYATIDSSMNPNEAFQPTGFLARFAKGDEEERERRKESRKGKAKSGQEAGGSQAGKENVLAGLKPEFRPELWFNRVEEGHLGLLTAKGLPRDFSLSAKGGYTTGLERWFYGAGIRRVWGGKGRGWLEVTYRRGPQTRYHSGSYRPVLTGALPLLGFADYFDYCWSEGFGIEIGYRLKKPRRQITLKVLDELYTSLEQSTDFDLLGRSQMPRGNPAVDEGKLRSLALKMALGDRYRPFGVTANRRLEVEIEHAASWLGGDFSFTRCALAWNWHVETFYKRRLAPNALDLRLVAGAATGQLPLQRFGVVDAALGPFTPFGALRAVRNRPYEGEKYTALFWEHNFKTVPFEALGLWALVRRGFGLVAHGASGRTWSPKTTREIPGYEPRYADGFHHEAGVSLVLYHFARLDLTRRLDRKAWSLGGSIARFDFD